MLRFRSLGSGSSGNATLIEAASGPSCTRLLVDCGLGIRQLERRLGEAGLEPAQISAIFITHEHTDHIGCAPSFARRHRIPVWTSVGTWQGAREPDFDGLLQHARDGELIDLGDLQVEPVAVPHDAREPLQLRCTDGHRHLGVLTDLGHVPQQVLDRLAGCQSMVLECNHDPDLLQASAYPYFLKRRVGGPMGHLANGDAAQAARFWQDHGLQQVLAAHLSKQNNTPEMAREALAQALGCAPQEIAVASPTQGSAWLEA